jgi:hypothetical protein
MQNSMGIISPYPLPISTTDSAGKPPKERLNFSLDFQLTDSPVGFSLSSTLWGQRHVGSVWGSRMNHSHGIARECLRGSRNSAALSYPYPPPPPTHTHRLSGLCALISVDVLLRPWSSAPRSLFIAPKRAEIDGSMMANAFETRSK